MALADGIDSEGSDIRECVRQLPLVGCNLAEFIWADPAQTERCMQYCEEFGIDGVFQNWDAFGGFQARKGVMDLNRETFERFTAHSREFGRFYGYYVWDEPFGEKTVKAAAKQLNEIEKLDPKRLPFVVAIPSYNPTATWDNGGFETYLNGFAETIDPPVLSLDYYPFSAKRPDPPDQLDEKKLFLDIALLRKLSLEKQIPMWFYVQALDSPQNEVYVKFPPEKLSVQVYNVLLHGGKGVQYYCTVDGTIYRDGRIGPLYFPMKALNHRLAAWGRTLMALQSAGVYHSPEVLAKTDAFEKYREHTADSAVLADEPLPFRCSVGELSDSEGNRYLMVLNRDYETARTFTLRFQRPSRVYAVSGETGLQKVIRRRASSLRVSLSPGDAVFLRVQDAEEEPFAVEYMMK